MSSEFPIADSKRFCKAKVMKKESLLAYPKGVMQEERTHVSIPEGVMQGRVGLPLNSYPGFGQPILDKLVQENKEYGWHRTHDLPPRHGVTGPLHSLLSAEERRDLLTITLNTSHLKLAMIITTSGRVRCTVVLRSGKSA